MGRGKESKTVEFLKKAYNSLLDSMFPEGYRCLGCGKELKSELHSRALCDECADSLPFKTGKLCSACGTGIFVGTLCRHCSCALPEYDKAYAPFFYEGLARKFVLDLKSRGREYIADYMAEYMYLYYSSLGIEADVVVNVPSTPRTLKRRGFDHTALIAEAFAARAELPSLSLLKRISHKKDQTKLSYAERFASVGGAFGLADASGAANKTVLLIDDVLTTGATASECAAVLKSAGAKRVNVLTFAR